MAVTVASRWVGSVEGLVSLSSRFGSEGSEGIEPKEGKLDNEPKLVFELYKSNWFRPKLSTIGPPAVGPDGGIGGMPLGGPLTACGIAREALFDLSMGDLVDCVGGESLGEVEIGCEVGEETRRGRGAVMFVTGTGADIMNKTHSG